MISELKCMRAITLYVQAGSTTALHWWKSELKSENKLLHHKGVLFHISRAIPTGITRINITAL